jgi:hypothetical protein
MGTTHYHLCSEDCSTGLTAGALVPVDDRVLRLGRHNKQLIYVQLGDEPSDEDPLVAACMEPAIAFAIVDTFNRWAPDIADRSAIFAELRANLDTLQGIRSSRPLIGEVYVVHRTEQVEKWLNEQEQELIEKEQANDR